MRLELILPRVEPTEFKTLLVCPHKKCQRRHFEHQQKVDKPLKDTTYEAVFAHHHRCLRCRQILRVYPQGNRSTALQRVKGLGVMLYLLKLSFRGNVSSLGYTGYVCEQNERARSGTGC